MSRCALESVEEPLLHAAALAEAELGWEKEMELATTLEKEMGWPVASRKESG